MNMMIDYATTITGLYLFRACVFLGCKYLRILFAQGVRNLVVSSQIYSAASCDNGRYVSNYCDIEAAHIDRTLSPHR